jgi:hypothetical protein
MLGPYAPVDLHLHSTASDGASTPAQVVERAAERGVRTIALCDHDTIDGVRPAQAAGAELGVTVLPGVELTCYWRERSVHMLAYGFEPENADLAADLAHRRGIRERHIGRILDRLAQLGMTLDHRRLIELADNAVVGRPLIAKALVDAGHAPDSRTAFERWLRKGRPAYFAPSEPQSPIEAIALLHRIGAIAVLAHPMLDRNLDLIDELATHNLDGLEAWHARHTAEDSARLNRWAERRGLLVTGGSDNHGPQQLPGIGEVWVPAEVVAGLTARRC